MDLKVLTLMLSIVEKLSVKVYVVKRTETGSCKVEVSSTPIVSETGRSPMYSQLPPGLISLC